MFKRSISLLLVFSLLIFTAAPEVNAADQGTLYAQVPEFTIQINHQYIDNNYTSNPLLVYKDVLYMPLTWSYASALGLQVLWSAETGIAIDQKEAIDMAQTVFSQDGDGYNNLGETKQVQLCQFPITINGVAIDNASEEYPLLSYANITYMPLTWAYTSEMNLQTSWSLETGYLVHVADVDPSQIMPTSYLCTYSNGYYEGQLLDGVRSGVGSYNWDDGDVYYGEWVEGGRTGYGYYTWVEGNFFEGQFVDGVRMEGTMTRANGTSYEYDYEAAQAAAEAQAKEAYYSEAYEGPSYDQLLKNEAGYIGQLTYFSGEVLSISENYDGSTYMIIDDASFANGFLDMYNEYNTSGYYMGNVESQYVGIYSPVSVDILQGDTIKAYGYVIYDLSFSDGYGSTYYFPSIELDEFERTSYRSEELWDMMFED